MRIGPCVSIFLLVYLKLRPWGQPHPLSPRRPGADRPHGPPHPTPPHPTPPPPHSVQFSSMSGSPPRQFCRHVSPGATLSHPFHWDGITFRA
ncbi:MAG: hypothetical protein C0504_06840 [Candidatus Solibacter sp.]|nr:hypothetical protein [Candidatus Solibacter sp.]